MTRAEAIAAAAAHMPALLRTLGVSVGSALATDVIAVVAEGLAAVLPEDVPIVATVERIERVDERP